MTSYYIIIIIRRRRNLEFPEVDDERKHGRERLAKLKKGIPKADIEKANRILEKKLENTEDICGCSLRVQCTLWGEQLGKEKG